MAPLLDAIRAAADVLPPTLPPLGDRRAELRRVFAAITRTRAPAGPPRRISLDPLPVADVGCLAANVLDVPELPDRIASQPDLLRDLAVPTALRDVIL